ncbi:Vacuolar protein sorting-associated protein 1 [Rhodotorula toruloides]|nr:Vacuolar protein sorting-associated protein 1 [Rhodotorula toruloides]
MCVRLSNLTAAKAVADAVRTSLGPRGMDKMIQTAQGEVVITNDGATILKHMSVLHPAARMDIEAGDGTTSVVVLAGSLLGAAEKLLGKGIHPTVIAESFARAAAKVVEYLEDMATPVNLNERDNLLRAATTSLSSKIVSQYSSILAPIAVDSVLRLVTPESDNVDLRDIRLVKKVGGTIDDTELMDGVLLNQNVITSAGGPTRIEKAKIGIIQFQLSPPKPDMDNQIVVNDYRQMDKILKEERLYILNLCKAIKKSGCNVLLIQKSILRDAVNELALAYLQKLKIMAIKDVERDEIEFLSRALGCKPISDVEQMTSDKLGEADLVEETSKNGAKFVKVSGIKNPSGKTVSVLCTGANQLVLEESERSLHDALCVVRCLVKKRFLICGGGAPEIEASRLLGQHAQTLKGMEAYCFAAYAEALEVVPTTLAENAGLNPIAMVTELRNRHANGEKTAGINVRKGVISNIVDESVLQPLLVNTSAIQLASETVGLLLRIDDYAMTRHRTRRSGCSESAQPAQSPHDHLAASSLDPDSHLATLARTASEQLECDKSIPEMDQQLIKTVNLLQDAFAQSGLSTSTIDLPQIAVVGSQSSTSSAATSCLEEPVSSLVVLSSSSSSTVLQRRRRTVMAKWRVLTRLRSSAKQEEGSKPTTDKASNPDEWAEFLHRPGEKFFDFNKVREEIVADTELKTGKNAGISPVPIGLRIFSPNVLTLTLVDLPGLTKVPVGDQPRDIEIQIRNMLLKYIQKPNSIILAVTAANTDLANSDGLKLAREVDPEGLRTIGVLTKVDLMDQGTDVVDILAGRVIPLRLGYVPVVNRSQRDIDNNRPIHAALDSERQFFENHPSYRSKASYCGTPYLTRRLNTILMHHIKATLPDIKQKISQNLTKYEAELASLGGPNGGTDGSSVILQIITEFCGDFRTAIDGSSSDLALNELSGGARVSFVFHELFSNGVKSLDPFDHVKDADIRTILYNSSGSSPALFVGTTAFEVIIKQQIKRIEEPSLKCASLVYDELMRILAQLLNKNTAFKRYPGLRDRFYGTVQNFFRKRMVPTNKLVQDLVAMESSYINTGHPDFISGHKAMAIVSERMNQNKPQNAGPAVDPKTGKLAPGTLNNGKDLDVDLRQKEEGFFGSFWPGGRKNQAIAQKKGAAAMDAPPPALRATGTLSEREQMETEVIKLLISSYFALSKRTLIDMVPKAIMLNLVFHARDSMQRELLSELYKTEMIEEMLKESDSVVQRRKECVKMVAALNKAESIVASVA